MTTILTEAFVIGGIAFMVSSGIFAISAFSLAKTGTILFSSTPMDQKFHDLCNKVLCTWDNACKSNCSPVEMRGRTTILAGDLKGLVYYVNRVHI